MNSSDLQRVNALSQERAAIQQALTVLSANGRITAMTVGRTDAMVMGGISVPTAYIDYPPQMVETIRTAFAARQQQIEQELGQLGVTVVPFGPPETR